MSESIWLRIVVVVGLVLPAIVQLARALILGRREQWDDLILNLVTDLAGAGVTYALFELVVGRRMAREAKQRALTAQLGSSVHDVAIAAAEELRRRDWLGKDMLHGAMMRRANLAGADLSGASLVGVDLSDASLHSADLRNADLSSAVLFRVTLMQADLSKAILKGAELAEADLSDVQGLTDEQLREVLSLQGATMPNSTHYNGRFNLEGDLVSAHRSMKVGTSDEAMAGFYGVRLWAYQWGQKWHKWSQSPPLMYDSDFQEWSEIQDDPDRDGSRWLIHPDAAENEYSLD